jgi:hypothetical protein
MDAVRMLFGRPVKPRVDSPTVAHVTASELDGLRREAEAADAKVGEFTQRLSAEQHALGQVEHQLAERLSMGEDASDLMVHVRQVEEHVRGLGLALHRVQQQQDQARTALLEATKQRELAQYAQAMERLKRDALTIDEALDTLEQSCTQAATSMLTIQQLRAGHTQGFIVTCRLELQRFADIAISPLTGTPKPPSRMMKYRKWSESIPSATSNIGGGAGGGTHEVSELHS